MVFRKVQEHAVKVLIRYIMSHDCYYILGESLMLGSNKTKSSLSYDLPLDLISRDSSLCV